jgi:acyl-coenzyme A synthetase/AMP-(fatty) acid ligase
MSSLTASFFRSIAGNQGKLLFAPEKNTAYTGASIVELIDAAAEFLDQNGIKRGNTFFCIADNTISTAVLILTAMRHGLTIAVLSPSFTRGEMKVWMKRLDIRAVVNASGKCIKHLEAPGIIEFSLDKLANFSGKLVPTEVDGDTFLITFTSGSTGEKKAILHSAFSILGCARAFNKKTGMSKKHRMLNVMPMHYMAGIFNSFIAPLEAGAEVVIRSAFSVETALGFRATIDEDGITHVWMAPAMVAMCVRLNRGPRNMPEKFENVFVGTGALSANTAKDFYAVFGEKPIQSYGLSELLYVSVDNSQDLDFGSCGTLLSGVCLVQNEQNCAEIISDYSCVGWMDGDLYSAAPAVFKTSDLVNIDDNDKITIIGRSDDVIIRGGLNIDPEQLEHSLEKVLVGKDFCISSTADDALGHALVLLVTKPHGDLSVVMSECNAVLRKNPGVAIDKVFSIKTISRSTTGKVQRKKVRAELQALMDSA